LVLTLRGTPFLYYGEEIGMRDIKLSFSEILDPPGKKYWPFYKGRDGCRSPMQWNQNSYSGFSNFKPWLPVHPNYLQRNVEKQQHDPASLLNFYKKLIKLRRAIPALQNGSFKLIPGLPSPVLSYIRELDNKRVLILLNFQLKTLHFTLPDDLNLQKGTILVNSIIDQELLITSSSHIEMQAGQTLIIELSS
jgi:alpha-glucosidase